MRTGSNLKNFLKEKNMTIKELAEKTDISLNTLYSITKRDSELSDDLIKKISSSLKIPIEELLEMLSSNSSDDTQAFIDETRRISAEFNEKIIDVNNLIQELNYLTKSYENQTKHKRILQDKLQDKLNKLEAINQEIERIKTELSVLENDIENRRVELSLLRKKLSSISFD